MSTKHYRDDEFNPSNHEMPLNVRTIIIYIIIVLNDFVTFSWLTREYVKSQLTSHVNRRIFVCRYDARITFRVRAPAVNRTRVVDFLRPMYGARSYTTRGQGIRNNSGARARRRIAKYIVTYVNRRQSIETNERAVGHDQPTRLKQTKIFCLFYKLTNIDRTIIFPRTFRTTDRILILIYKKKKK